MNDWKGNKNSTWVTLGASNHSLGERQKEDYYATEPAATDWLCKLETFTNPILEPSCGEGHISKQLIKHGYDVVSRDLVDRGFGEVKDFLYMNNEKWSGDIITNPPYKCFDVDTQCYTKRGWLNYQELNYNDEILSINPNTQEIEWSKIKNIIIREKQPEEKMYHFKSSHMDIMVTEGHRMFAFSKANNKLVCYNNDLVKSERLRSTHYIPRTGYFWKGEEKEKFVLPAINGKKYAQPTVKEAIEINMDDWLRFFGMWIADGCCRHTKNSQGNYRKVVEIKQLASRRKVIKNILDRLPFKYIEREDNYNRKNHCINFIINNEQLWEYLIQFGYSEDKFIPYEIKNLSQRQLEIFLESYFQGDGSYYMEKGKTFRTISKQLSEDVWEVLFKLGYLSHICGLNSTYHTSKGKEHHCYFINYNPNSVYNKVTFKSNKNDACLCNYTGIVWCVELEKNGVFVLRRNGQEFVCGNCSLQFVEQALSMIQEGHKVAMFLKLTFLEGKQRAKLFKENPPIRIWVSSSRLKCAKNGDFEQFKSSATAYAWFIWEKGYKGYPEIRWFND